jgi:hypothetical protein
VATLDGKLTVHVRLSRCRDVLVMVMRKHQRYFPVFSADGKLLPAFITVANGPVDPAAVAAGNEAVLRARFEDATFFYKQDLEQQLADFKWVSDQSVRTCIVDGVCTQVKYQEEVLIDWHTTPGW